MSRKLLDKEQFLAALPKRRSNSVHQKDVDKVNEILQDEDLHENLVDNLVSYANVLEGKINVTMTQYISAVTYVSYKLLGKTNVQAYSLVFPERMESHVTRGKSDGAIAGFVAGYNRTKLVTDIMAQTVIPVYILNQHNLQKAINKQVSLMATASDTVAQKAATALMDHLKMPEVAQVQLDVNVSNESEASAIMQELKDTTVKLAQQQQMMIECGQRTALDIAETEIISVTVED